jgi:hypothetical protein
MIAAQRVEPELRRIDRVRHAADRRVRRTRRRLHRPVHAVATLTILLLLPLLGYVALTSRITSQSFALVRAEHDRTALVDETQRLDDRIAQLQSPERLAALAANLKLHDPHVYAVVRIPEPKAQPRPTGLAFFGTLFSGSSR